MIALSALVLEKNPAHLSIIYFSLSPYDPCFFEAGFLDPADAVGGSVVEGACDVDELTRVPDEESQALSICSSFECSRIFTDER